MEVAENTAQLSYAKRLKVGAVVVKDSNIISFGYNGTPAGMNNDCEEKVWTQDGNYTLKTKSEVIHAEANAITKLARQSGSGEGASLFITHAPCIECAKLIVQSGIKTVYFKSHYRNNEGLELLHNAGLTTFQSEV
jgi:dCMP deaminase